MTPLSLFLNILISSIGFGYYVFGKKQQNTVFIFDGLALLVFPYFIANMWLTIIIGLVLTAIPFLYKNG
jgi:hypothetical protein